jgi:hypothetical protein
MTETGGSIILVPGKDLLLANQRANRKVFTIFFFFDIVKCFRMAY